MQTAAPSDLPRASTTERGLPADVHSWLDVGLSGSPQPGPMEGWHSSVEASCSQTSREGTRGHVGFPGAFTNAGVTTCQVPAHPSGRWLLGLTSPGGRDEAGLDAAAPLAREGLAGTTKGGLLSPFRVSAGTCVLAWNRGERVPGRAGHPVGGGALPSAHTGRPLPDPYARRRPCRQHPVLPLSPRLLLFLCPLLPSSLSSPCSRSIDKLSILISRGQKNQSRSPHGQMPEQTDLLSNYLLV